MRSAEPPGLVSVTVCAALWAEPTPWLAKDRPVVLRPTAGTGVSAGPGVQPVTAAGPPTTPGPFSKNVSSVRASGSRPSHTARDSAPTKDVPVGDTPPTARARSLSVGRLYVAVHAVPVAVSYFRVPSVPAPPARRVRRPLRSNASRLAMSRFSSWSTGICLPATSAAVPWTWTVPPPAAFVPVTIGRSATTLDTVVWSATPNLLVNRTTSPGTRFGVFGVPAVPQQPPPGWLTSTTPSPGVAGSATGVICLDWPTTRPARMTLTVIGPSLSAQPVDDTKSRA